MNDALNTWQLIRNSLRRQVPVMLLYVLESSGSSPGRQGFNMAVTAKGDMAGSIGGGIMEHKLVTLALEKLKVQQQKFLIRKQIHNQNAGKDRSGMICSGEQTILLYPVQPQDAGPVGQVVDCLEKGQTGNLQLSPDGLHFSAEDSPADSYSYTFQTEADWLYQEKLGFKNHLYIVGGGHCALALSRCMQPLGFCLHLYDDRTGLNTFCQNTYVQEKKLVQSYEELSRLIPSGKDNYVVVMTFGYRTDDVAVRALLGKQFRYFGLLGSRSKIENLFSTYSAEGIAPELLEAIHAPVGLPINSQTPAEIAISIAAEIIREKNRK